MYLSKTFCINQRISNLAGYLVHGNHVAIQSRIGMKFFYRVKRFHTCILIKLVDLLRQVHISTSSLYKMLQN